MSQEELGKLRRQEAERRVASCRERYNKLKDELDAMDFTMPVEKFERACAAGLLVAREELSRRLTQQFQLRMNVDKCRSNLAQEEYFLGRAWHSDVDQGLLKELDQLLISFRQLHQRYIEAHELHESTIDALQQKLWKFEVDSYQTKEALLRFMRRWETFLQNTRREDYVTDRMAMTFVRLGQEALNGRFKDSEGE